MINEFLMNQKNRMKFAVSRSIDKACGELVDSAIEKGKYALREHFGTVVLYEQTRQPTQIAYKYIYNLDKEKYKKNINNGDTYYKPSSYTVHHLKVGTKYFINLDECILFVKVMYLKELNTYGVSDDDGCPTVLYLYFFGKNAYRERKKMHEYISGELKKLDKSQTFAVKRRYIDIYSINDDFQLVSNNTVPISTIKMSDVILDEKIKTDLIDYITTWDKSENEFREYGLSFNLGILLYGKPGTGKTSLIKLIASETGYSVVNINLSSIQRSVQAITGSSTPTATPIAGITTLRFSSYHGVGPGDKLIIVMEDFDFIFGNREELVDKEDKKNVNDLLQLLDGFTNIASKVIFVATTNRLETLDEAIIREGRFDIKIEMTDFDKENAIKMCKKFKIDESVLEGESYPINPAYLQSKILKKKMEEIKKSSNLIHTN